MLGDVLAATEAWKHRYVVTADPDAEAVAKAAGCIRIYDHDGELNSALAVGTGAALEAAVTRLLILPADVPLVTPGDVAKLFGFEEQVVIALSDDGGTTGLLRSPPDVIAPEFGPHSGSQHLLAAEKAGATARQVSLDSLTLDVDDLGGLKQLAAGNRQDRQAVLLARQFVLEQIGHGEGG